MIEIIVENERVQPIGKLIRYGTIRVAFQMTELPKNPFCFFLFPSAVFLIRLAFLLLTSYFLLLPSSFPNLSINREDITNIKEATNIKVDIALIAGVTENFIIP